MPTLPTSDSTGVTEKRLLLFPAELPVICCQRLTKTPAQTIQAGGFQKVPIMHRLEDSIPITPAEDSR